MTEKRSRFLDAFLTVPGWLDWIGRAWPWILAFGGASLMSALARATLWLDQWGPIAWGLAFLFTFVVIYVVAIVGIAVAARARERRAMARYTEGVVDTSSINPLDRLFEAKRINLRDFYHPFFKWHPRPTFRHCEIYGPTNVALRGLPAFENSSFIDCEWVILRDGVTLTNVVGLDSPVFEHCEIFRVTFFVAPIDAGRFVAAAGMAGINIVSQGEPVLPAPAPRPEA